MEKTKQLKEGKISDTFKKIIGTNSKEKSTVPMTNDEIEHLLKSGMKPYDLFDGVGESHGGLTEVYLNDKYNFINKKGNLLSKQWFDDISYPFWEDYAIIILNSKYNAINKQGNYLFKQWFDNLDLFYSGYAAVKLNGKGNIIDKQGNYLFKQWFDRISGLDESGRFRVELNGKCNFIDKKGQPISKQWFDDAGAFYEGYTTVELKGKKMYMDTKGHLQSDRPETLWEGRNALKNTQPKPVVKEDTSRVVKLTPKSGNAAGDSTIEPMSQEEITAVRSKAPNVKMTDMNTGQSLNEEEGQALDMEDLVTAGKTLQAVVEDTLRAHGDKVAYTRAKANVGRTKIIIPVQYERNAEDGDVSAEDRFEFIVNGGKVKLSDNGAFHDICPITNNSGTIEINRDLAKEALMKFIDSKTSDVAEGEATKEDYPNGQGFENKGMEAQDSYKTDEETLSEELLLGFRKAADAYKANPKNKEVVKELLRQARNFEGDTIQQKLKNAIAQYKNMPEPGSDEAIDDELGTDRVDGPEAAVVAVADEEPVVSAQDERCCDCDICLDMSLLIRLFEFAHEEAADDVALHFAAENLQKICKEKGCATMADYETIIAESDAKKGEMDENWYEPTDDEIDDLRNSKPFGDKNEMTEDEEHPEYDLELTGEVKSINPDVAVRAQHLDHMHQSIKDAVMDSMSELFNLPESLDDSVEEYILHTYPQMTVEEFKSAVDNALSK